MNTESKTNCQVFFVDDEDYIRLAAEQALGLADMNVSCFDNAQKALQQIHTDWHGVLITDLKMPGMDGYQLMQDVLALDPQIPVILISGHADISTAVKAIHEGAYDFVEKPFNASALTEVVRRAIDKRSLVMDNRMLRAELAQQRSETRLIGRSKAMQELNQTLSYVATTDVDILIHGETGSGKELVAETIHELSNRNQHRFVAINCGAMPENLFESELFGHVKGAFTGAEKDHMGKLEYANQGTFLLDEIESMPLALQIKMLRVLQERKIQRVGSNSDIALDLRVIAATKDDLLESSQAGNFREDLYYRLNVVTIRIPPLRERKEDIPILFQYFSDAAAERMQRDPLQLTDELLQQLIEHDWPGNVRELQNFAERAAIGLTGIDGVSSSTGSSGSVSTMQLSEQMDAFEKLTIERALQANNGSLTQTFKALGISRKTLYDKIRKHGLNQESG